jgi:misacylated tRNA(Ala) deacylase
MTDLLYSTQAYLRTFDATVVHVRDRDVALDRTAFYPTGGGQPHDLGHLGPHVVVDVKRDGDIVWHSIEDALPPIGKPLHCEIDWDRRYALMRTHTALHVLCGVIYHTWGKSVTGGNMDTLSARIDFDFDPLPPQFAQVVEEAVNAELAQDRPVQISFLPRDTALVDQDLIRTKVNLVPESVRTIRVVDIVGLDKQADGGTHVQSTSEVGRVRITKTESKGKSNKRVRFDVFDP